MTAFVKGSSNISYVACQHFVRQKIDLMDNKMNTFKTEFKELFLYLFTEISLTVAFKVHIVMVNLKQHKKTKFVSLFPFSQQH